MCNHGFMAKGERVARWRYALQPWRYDFEGARDFLRAGFPVYGLAHPEPELRRMGGKGKMGPAAPLRALQPLVPKKLISLELMHSSSDWEVRVDTKAGWFEGQLLNFSRATCENYRGHRGKMSPDVSPTPRDVDLSVDGKDITFEGLELGRMWVGTALVDEVGVSVEATNIDPTELELTAISDPAEHLKGQSKYMRS